MNTNDYSFSDLNGIIYVSPSFSGFEFGLSYKSDTTTGGGSNSDQRQKREENGWGLWRCHRPWREIQHEMDNFSLGVSGGYQTLSADAEMAPTVT